MVERKMQEMIFALAIGCVIGILASSFMANIKFGYFSKAKHVKEEDKLEVKKDDEVMKFEKSQLLQDVTEVDEVRKDGTEGERVGEVQN
jgi:hypothetical protein